MFAEIKKTANYHQHGIWLKLRLTDEMDVGALALGLKCLKSKIKKKVIS